MKYKKADMNFISLLRNIPFNAAGAVKLVENINDINALVIDESGFETTYLEQATEYNNYDAVVFLFEHGADPNYCCDELGICPFWDLQYIDIDAADIEAEKEIKYKLTKLFLENGANPYLSCENNESLIYYVAFKANEDKCEPDWEYIDRFYKLLESYTE